MFLKASCQKQQQRKVDAVVHTDIVLRYIQQHTS